MAAAEFVIRSKKDGYTILYISSAGAVYTRVVSKEASYDPNKDLEHLGVHIFFPTAVAVQAKSPWKTFGELVDYAKKNPGAVRVSTMGEGSIAAFNLHITQGMTGAKFTHIPVGSGQEIVTALLGGHVEVSYDQFGKFEPYVQSKELRYLLTGKKMPSYPSIPTMKELGYQQDFLTGWYALFAPLGVPDEVKNVLIPAIEKAAKSPEARTKLDKIGFSADYKPPSEGKRLITEDYETAKGIAVKIGLRNW